MKKPYNQPQPPASEDVRVACELIRSDDDRSAAIEALISGSAARTYRQLLGREVYDLTNTELIWTVWYRLGLARGPDDDIVVECLKGLDRRRHH